MKLYAFAVYAAFAAAMPADKSAVQMAMERNSFVHSESGHGSGVLLDCFNHKGRVLSNFHILMHDERVGVGVYEVRVLKVSPKYDLALLESRCDDNLPTLKFSDVKVDEDIFYVGNPMGVIDSLVRGRAINLDDKYIYSDVLATEGFSGSGTYNAKGELVGICNGWKKSPGGGSALALITRASVIKEFLKE